MPENIIQIDQNLFETKLDRLVTEKMTQILNAMLDAEADEITGAARYLELEGPDMRRKPDNDTRPDILKKE